MKYKFVLIIVFFGIGLFAQNGIDCYTIVVGKNASATGSVLVAHNEDDYGDLIVNLFKVPANYDTDSLVELTTGISIPQVKKTFSYVWFETTQQKFGDFFVNEFGVTICSNACTSKEKNAEGKIDYDLRILVAQRAASARQAVEIAGELVEKYGYASSGRTYCFADAHEAWLMAVVRGNHWVAQRVPDDKVAIVPNYYTIGEINFQDSENFLGSADVIDYAISKYWYNPKSGEPFNFRKAYSTNLNLHASWNIPRHWGGINLLADKKYGLHADFPFAFNAKEKVLINKLQNVLSYHYEETDLETCKALKKNPHNNMTNRICNPSTKFSVVVELHNTYPENNTNVIWYAPYNPCINPYIPIACSIDSFPAVFQNRKFSETRKYHFDKKSNIYKANPKHAYSVFYAQNTLINNDYWVKSVSAKKNKKQFEQKFINTFKKNPKGETSYKLLMEYYNYSIR
ncbi:MAG: C69 family dipeptidase [Bacteroidota bacterium]|nr:C69 family dipeptidase [Bacteroidota bacterium]